jgi:hypothetical protein
LKFITTAEGVIQQMDINPLLFRAS